MFSFAWWALNQKWEVKMVNWLFLSYFKKTFWKHNGRLFKCSGWSAGISWLLSAKDYVWDYHWPLASFLWSTLLCNSPGFHCGLYFLVPSFYMFMYSFHFRLIAFFPISILHIFIIAYEFMLTSIKESLCSLTFTTFSFNLFSAHLEANTVTPYLSGIIEEYLIFHITEFLYN